MSPCKRHTQHSTSKATPHNIVKPNTHLCRVRTSIWEPPHHPQYQKTYLIQASQKSTLSPSASIPTSVLIPLYLLLVLLSILSAILINYLTTFESFSKVILIIIILPLLNIALCVITLVILVARCRESKILSEIYKALLG